MDGESFSSATIYKVQKFVIRSNTSLVVSIVNSCVFMVKILLLRLHLSTATLPSQHFGAGLKQCIGSRYTLIRSLAGDLEEDPTSGTHIVTFRGQFNMRINSQYMKNLDILLTDTMGDTWC